MDKEKQKDSIINKLKEAQMEIPNLTLPTMGIINIDNKVKINGKEFIKNSSAKED